MTSTTFLNKSSDRFCGFKETYIWAVKKQLGIMGLLGLLLFFGYPVLLFVYMTNKLVYTAGGQLPYYSEHFAGYVNTVVPVGVTPLCLLFSAVLAISLFSYMHSKRSVDLFHAVPVRREALLMGRFMAGETVLLVPLLLVFLVAALIGAGYGALNGGILWLMVKQFLWLALMLTATFSFCMLLMVCSGTTFDAVISGLGISVAYPILIFCCISFISHILLGYPVQDNAPLILATAFSPVIAAFLPQIKFFFREEYAFSTATFLTWWIVLTIVFIAVSILFYSRRKSETAENNFAFPLPKNIIRFMLTAASGMGFGLMLQSICYNSYNFFVGLLIGSFVAHVVMEALYNRGFRNIKKGLMHYAVFLIVFSLFYGALSIGGFGYVTHVPNVEEVESVYFYGRESQTIDYQKMSRLSQGGEDAIGYEVVHPQMKSEEVIKQTITFHQKLVDFYMANNFPLHLQESIGNTYKLEYHLKNGKIIRREYTDPTIQNADGSVSTVLTDENVVAAKDYKKSNHLLFYLEPEYISDIQVSYVGVDNVDEGYISGYHPSKEIKKKLLEAMEKDILENGMDDEYSDNDNKNTHEIIISCNLPFTAKEGSALSTLIGGYTGEIELNESRYVVKKDCKNTIKLLEELHWKSK